MATECNDEDLLASAEKLLLSRGEGGDSSAAIEQGPLDSPWFASFLGTLAESETPPESLLGRVVGTVEILRIVGVGGMGVVYEGWDRRLERRVALKRLSDLVDADTSGRVGLLREARALSRLDHPGICRVLDLVEDESGDLLVMEFLEGCSLRQVLEEGPDFAERLRIATEIAAALAAAHSAGVVHRDMKPENVVIQTDGTAKVLDFGIAKLAEGGDDASGPTPSEATGKTSIASLKMGTPFYMSPEQARGEAVGPAADAWSFGIVLRDLFGTGDGAHPKLARLISDLTSETAEQRCSMEEVHHRLEELRALPLRQRRRRRALLLVAAASILGVLLSAAVLRFRSAEEAQWREEWEEEVAWVEQMKHHAFRQPLHDVRDELARIEERSRRLAEAVDRAPGIARRSGAAALGRIHLEVDGPETARGYLEDAVAGGARDAATTRALGEALGRLYIAQLQEVDDLSSPALREQRLDVARTELLQPAKRWLEQASKGDPDSSSLTLARIAFLEERFEDALSLADQVADENPWLYDAHLLAGSVHHERGRRLLREGAPADAAIDLDAAAARFEQALEIAPSSPESLGEACNLASHKVALLSNGLDGDFDILFERAIGRCERVLEANPDLSYYSARLAHIQLRRAQRVFYSGGDPTLDLETALERSTRAISAQPTAFAHSQRAWAYLLSVLSDRARGIDASDNLQAMIADLAIAKQLEPNNTATYATALWGASVGAEYERDFGGDPTSIVETAHQDYLKTLELDPTNDVAHMNMGWCWVVLAQHEVRSGGDPTKAATMALEIFARDKDNYASNPNLTGNIGEAHLTIAEHQLLQGTPPGQALRAARDATRASIELDDKIFWTHLDLAYADLLEAEWLLRQNSRIDRVPALLESAERHAQASLEIYPAYPITHKALGQIDFLDALWHRANGDSIGPSASRARQHLDKSLELDPRFSEALARRGILDAFVVGASAPSGNADLTAALEINRNSRPFIDQHRLWLQQESDF